MDLQDLLTDSPKLHGGGTISWGLSYEVLSYINEHANETFRTLETGAGLSTILFALKGTEHTCILPDKDIIDRIAEYCAQKQISLQKVNFVLDISENALPRLELTALDLVLIDGRHGFPAPFIDWYYTAPALKLKGTLIIDDTQLWTGDVLKRFLLSEPEWKLKQEFSSRACVFVKLAEGSESKEWCDQPYTVLNSDLTEGPHANRPVERVRRLVGHLRAGEFSILGRKIRRNIIG